jgi:hypothetical protein
MNGEDGGGEDSHELTVNTLREGAFRQKVQYWTRNVHNRVG